MSDARIRMERRNLDGTWEAYTAWYGPEHRTHLERSVQMQSEKWDTANSYRLVEETDTPEG
jgi:hypothetical protein